MKYLCVIVLAAAFLPGCTILGVKPPPRYTPAANYGDSGETPCGTHQAWDCTLPWCRK